MSDLPSNPAKTRIVIWDVQLVFTRDRACAVTDFASEDKRTSVEIRDEPP